MNITGTYTLLLPLPGWSKQVSMTLTQIEQVLTGELENPFTEGAVCALEGQLAADDALALQTYIGRTLYQFSGTAADGVLSLSMLTFRPLRGML